MKAIARALHGTVNDVLVATIAGALRRHFAREGIELDGREVRAMVPVNLRVPGAPLELGNRFGLAIIDLPIAADDPLARVAATERRMQTFKATPEAAVSLAVLRAMGVAPPAVERAGVDFFGSKASLVLTNVPGPRVRVSLAGAPVSRVVFWAPQSGRMGLGISIFSYAGEITVGIVADTHVVFDPTALAADLHVELTAIAAAVRSPENAEVFPLRP